MRVNEIRVKRIRVNQGLGVQCSDQIANLVKDFLFTNKFSTNERTRI